MRALCRGGRACPAFLLLPLNCKRHPFLQSWGEDTDELFIITLLLHRFYVYTYVFEIKSSKEEEKKFKISRGEGDLEHLMRTGYGDDRALEWIRRVEKEERQ